MTRDILCNQILVSYGGICNCNANQHTRTNSFDRMGRVAFKATYLRQFCRESELLSIEESRANFPCHNVEIDSFLFFATLVWPKNRMFVNFDCEIPANCPNISIQTAMRSMQVDTVFSTYVATENRMKRYSFAVIRVRQPRVYYSKELLRQTRSNYVLESLRKLTKPVGTGIWLLTLLSQLLYGICGPLLRQHGGVERRSHTIAQLMGLVFSFVYGLNSKMEAIASAPRSPPFSSANELIDLIRKRQVHIVFSRHGAFLHRVRFSQCCHNISGVVKIQRVTVTSGYMNI